MSLVRRGRLARLPVESSDVLIVVGCACALLGLYLLVGLAWVLVAGGLVAAGYGVAADLRGTAARDGRSPPASAGRTP